MTLSGVYVSWSPSNPAEGGAIHNNEDLTLQDVYISGNSSLYGGGIFNDGGTVRLINSTVDNNWARYDTVDSTTGGGEGGGIFNRGGTVTLFNSTVAGNKCTAYSTSTIAGTGGAIYNAGGTVTITSSTLSGNSAYNIGGIFNSGGGRVTLTNSTLWRNTNNLGTDGILNVGTATITNCTLFDAGIGNAGTMELDNTIVAHTTSGVVDVTTSDATNLNGSNNLIQT